MSFELVMPSNHLILCHPLLPPSNFPSIRVFYPAGEASLVPGWGRFPEEGNGKTPVFLPGKSRGQRSLMAYIPWDGKRVGRNSANKTAATTSKVGRGWGASSVNTCSSAPGHQWLLSSLHGEPTLFGMSGFHPTGRAGTSVRKKHP